MSTEEAVDVGKNIEGDAPDVEPTVETDSAVSKRIKRLEEIGVIKGYRPKIDYDLAGFPSRSCSPVPPPHRS